MDIDILSLLFDSHSIRMPAGPGFTHLTTMIWGFNCPPAETSFSFKSFFEGDLGGGDHFSVPFQQDYDNFA